MTAQPSRVLIVAGLLAAAAPSAWACNIPVFRYALERWQADSCRVLVYHDAPLSESQQATLRGWQRSSEESGGAANAAIVQRQVRHDGAAGEDPVWDSLRSRPEVSLPFVVCQIELPRGRRFVAWEGTLQQAGQTELLDSPVRRELAERLLAGDSVVWLVLEPGQAATDRSEKEPTEDRSATERVQALLDEQFKSLRRRLRLPDGIGLPGSELHSEVPLLLRFSRLTIRADDPEEAFLVSLLGGLRPEAFKRGEPLVMPVFGRGRALEVIPASELDGRLIEELTVFLGGACSCQVKELNPGFDLPMAADWAGELFAEGQQPPADDPGLQRRRSPILVPIPPGKDR